MVENKKVYYYRIGHSLHLNSEITGITGREITEENVKEYPHSINEYLAGRNIKDVDLKGAYLRGIDLRKVDLSGADLRRADLSGADLKYAHLEGVCLIGVNLYGTRLSINSLKKIDLTGAYFGRYELVSCSSR